MRNTFLYILFALLPAVMPLAKVQGTLVAHGTYYALPNPQGVDRVLIYRDLSATDAYLEYVGAGTPVWKDFQGVVKQSGGELYPDPAVGGYVLYAPDDTVSFYVFDYKQVAPDYSMLQLTVEDMQCEHSLLNLTGAIPEMAYTTASGKHWVDREPTISFVSLSWGGEAWVDSLAEEQVTLQYGVASQPISVAAPYQNTTFALRMDPWVETAWSQARDSVVSEEATAVAVCAHPMSVTTSRDYNGLGVENEPDRPIDETVLTGSAPLEINFLANGNKPTARYYRWRILKGSDLLAERFDEEQRYTFWENGSYQVKVWVYNDQCTTDSTVFDISVSSSMLKVPNVFTPNGDGQNDEFRVVYRSLKEFHCWVYNRWGHLVYEWSDPAKGWDGTINGHPAAEGAYYYIIRARGTDAEEGAKYHKETKRRPRAIGVYQLSGHINLLRGKNNAN